MPINTQRESALPMMRMALSFLHMMMKTKYNFDQQGWPYFTWNDGVLHKLLA